MLLLSCVGGTCGWREAACLRLRDPVFPLMHRARENDTRFGRSTADTRRIGAAPPGPCRARTHGADHAQTKCTAPPVSDVVVHSERDGTRD